MFVFVITLQHCCTLVNLLHQWWVLFHLSPTCDPAAFAPKPLCLFSTVCHRVVHNPFAVICICPAPPTNRLYWVPYSCCIIVACCLPPLLLLALSLLQLPQPAYNLSWSASACVPLLLTLLCDLHMTNVANRFVLAIHAFLLYFCCCCYVFVALKCAILADCFFGQLMKCLRFL